MVSEEQTAANKDNDQSDKGKTGNESESAHGNDVDELDQLLSEFESKSEPAPNLEQKKAKPETVEQPDLKSVTERLDRIAKRDEEREELERRQKLDADIQKAVKEVRGDLPVNIDDSMVEAWLDAKARKDDRFRQAWQARNDSPAAFNKVLKALSKDLARQFANSPDPNVSEDAEIVASAVKGSSKQAPEEKAPDYNGMSNADFAADIRKKFGFDPLG